MPAAKSVPADEPQHLKRDFTLISAFALAFAFISPIVALYTIFGLGIVTAGPAFWWGFLVVLVGQVFVALVFGELVSRWPLEGSVFQWSRYLLGDTYGWFAGWAYMWTLAIAVTAVCYGAATFLAPLFDIEDPSNGTLVLLGLGVLAFATVVNTIGRKFMKLMVALSITAEVIGSIGVGTVLLLFHREHGLGVLFEGQAGGHGAYLTGGFLAGLAFIGWAFVGFESAGAIAEEVEDPRRNVPKAILLSLLLVALVVVYSGLALILAIPNLDAVLAGASADPITDILSSQLGSGVVKPLFALFVIGFAAAVIALQAGSSRVVYSFARDRALPAPRFLGKLSHRDALPINAILVVALISGLLFAMTGSSIYITLVSFTTGGFYIAFAFPIVAALIVRLRGGWTEGPFSLGRRGVLVNTIAVIWLAGEIVNIAWPRANELPWYQNWGVVVMTVVLGVMGIGIYLSRRTRIVRVAEAGAAGNQIAPTEPVPAQAQA